MDGPPKRHATNPVLFGIKTAAPISKNKKLHMVMVSIPLTNKFSNGCCIKYFLLNVSVTTKPSSLKILNELSRFFSMYKLQQRLYITYMHLP